MRYGVSYYPEHKSAAELDHDVELIIQSGIDIVRMGEFAWSRFERRDGSFDELWLTPVIERFGAAGIKTIVCTPTACPPAWLVEAYPEIRYVDNRGVVRPFGGRRPYCYVNATYREYSRRIAEQIAIWYGDHPHVLGFQIDNELAQEATGRCHCRACRDAFRQWLTDKYGTIDELNRRMGTVFWSQEYDSFNQVSMPVNTIEVGATNSIRMFYENPSLRLDYERFCSDSLIEYQDIQAGALRRHTAKPVTSNGTGLATNSIDYYRGYRSLDVYAYDFYPSLRDGAISSFSYAHGRGIKNEEFWLLEFVSSGGHRLGGSGRLQPYPGALAQSVMHAACSGASLLAHFQFRTFPYGAEQLNYAIVDADGIPRRAYREVQTAAVALRRTRQWLESGSVANDVALCFDYDVLWSLAIKPFQSETFDYVRTSNEIYDALARRGVGCDVVSYEHDLDRYKMVVLTTPSLCGDGLKERLRRYVDAGGVLVTTFVAAIKNEDNVGFTEPLPAGLTDLFGIVVSEVEPVYRRTIGEVWFPQLGKSFSNLHWTEVLEPDSADAFALYSGGFRDGLPVAARNRYGNGLAYYLGTGFGAEDTAEVLHWIARDAGVERLPFSWSGVVECVRRRGPANGSDAPRDVGYALFNFEKAPATVHADQLLRDVESGESIDGEFEIPAKGWRLLQV